MSALGQAGHSAMSPRCPVWPKADGRVTSSNRPLEPRPSRIPVDQTGIARVADDAAEPLALGEQVFQQATRDELIEQLPQRQQETLCLVFADDGVGLLYHAECSGMRLPRDEELRGHRCRLLKRDLDLGLGGAGAFLWLGGHRGRSRSAGTGGIPDTGQNTLMLPMCVLSAPDSASPWNHMIWIQRREFIALIGGAAAAICRSRPRLGSPPW